MVWAHGIVTGASSEENDSFFWCGEGHVPGETARLCEISEPERKRFAQGLEGDKLFPFFFWTTRSERRSLSFMVMKRMSFAETDPVLAAIHAAPVVEASPEEMAAFEEGLAEIRAGRSIPAAQIRQMLDS